MSLWKIAWRSIEQRFLASALTAFAMGLGVALVVAVLVIYGVIDKSFNRGSQGYDLIVGPEGSKLELVLNTVFHIGAPLDPIPASVCEKLKTDERFSDCIEAYVPICMGHVYKDLQVIATDTNMFGKLKYGDNQSYRFADGVNLDETYYVVLGSEAAKQTGLKVGDAFKLYPPKEKTNTEDSEESEEVLPYPCKVAGILEPTGTPDDQKILFDSTRMTEDPICENNTFKNAPVATIKPDKLQKDYRFADGESFTSSRNFEAVLGATAAKLTRLKVGDTFKPSHPTDNEKKSKQQQAEEENHHHPFTVVGILEPTSTPNDRAIFIDLEGFYQMGCHNHLFDTKGQDEDEKDHKEEPQNASATTPHEDHHADHHDHHHEDHKISAALVALKANDPNSMNLINYINNSTLPKKNPNDIPQKLFPGVQAVQPAKEIAELLDKIIGNVQLLLLTLAILVVIVAGIGILVSIYNSMSDRRHEIAIMRALGASRMHVGAIILLESILLSLGGGAIGVFLGHGLVGLLSSKIAEQTGVIVHAYQFQVQELILIPGLILLASIVGYLPAAVAYRTDVAKSLSAGQ